jgi:death on curing protein
VLEIHALQLGEFGGIAGVRDRGLLESAVEQPRATAFGELLHTDLFEMAAAYLFHIVKNHAFLDGNKRTALVAALVFLDINGVSLERDGNAGVN